MVDNHQNTVCHRQDSSLGAQTGRQSMVLGRQVAPFGTDCGPGRFHQGRTQPPVAFASGTSALLAVCRSVVIMLLPWKCCGSD
jgi:hypothetical protein